MSQDINFKKLEKLITPAMRDKHLAKFGRQAVYLGNGVYLASNVYSTDTGQLMLAFCAIEEGIPLPYIK